jgi:CubicO group peptidase (beta-lactamase class C family)
MMGAKRTSIRGYIIGLALLGSVTANWACGDDEVATRLAEVMNRHVRDGGFSGSVLVARNGVPLLRQGYGMANREHDVPNTPETKFRLGSLTKQFTAAAILLLQEDGRLDVRAAVKEYLRDAPPAWDGVTVHQLLSHTAGIPNYLTQIQLAIRSSEPMTPDMLLARLKDRPLDFAPGSKFAYSNAGYTVLGRIIEAVSGKPYAGFLRERIFAPAGMDDSGYDDARPILRHRAAGYVRVEGELKNAPRIESTVPYSAGGLYSTVDDLLKWDRALAGDLLLSKESLESMFTPVREDYAYGWRVVRVEGRTTVGHSGSIPGFSSHIRRVPEEGLCIIVLSNMERTPVVPIGNHLAAALAAPKAGAAGR